MDCQICTRNKSSHRPLAGLLQLLEIPRHPWAQIALDFVTGLSSSQGVTTILTVIERFSKACLLVPLRKLPSAFQMAQLLIKHIFRLHGILVKNLSIRDLSLFPRYGSSSASHLMQKFNSYQIITPNPMVKRSR